MLQFHREVVGPRGIRSTEHDNTWLSPGNKCGGAERRQQGTTSKDRHVQRQRMGRSRPSTSVVGYRNR